MRHIYFILLISVVGLISCDDTVETNITSFRSNTNFFDEGSSNQNIEIIITAEGTVGEDLTIPYQVIEGTALFGTDINGAAGDLQFSAGSNQATLSLELVGDSFFELEETFDITLTYNGNPTRFTFAIYDDDEVETVQEDAEGFITSSELGSMRNIWSDEFDGTELNSSNWTYEIGDGCDKGICGWGNNELQNYTDQSQNVSVENGRLSITALSDGSGNYTSGRIITQDKVELQYGRIDIRAKLPKGKGLWPALWMLGANIDDEGWAKCGEIDIMELRGDTPNVTIATVHWQENGNNTYNDRSTSLGAGEGDFSDKFHVWTLVWERNYMGFYLDGRLFRTWDSSQATEYPFNEDFFFLMNVAVGGNFLENPDSSTEFPQTMEVDYIRVFQ